MNGGDQNYWFSDCLRLAPEDRSQGRAGRQNALGNCQGLPWEIPIMLILVWFLKASRKSTSAMRCHDLIPQALDLADVSEVSWKDCQRTIIVPVLRVTISLFLLFKPPAWYSSSDLKVTAFHSLSLWPCKARCRVVCRICMGQRRSLTLFRYSECSPNQFSLA